MEKAEILIRVLEPEIDAKCAEIRQKKKRKTADKSLYSGSGDYAYNPCITYIFRSKSFYGIYSDNIYRSGIFKHITDFNKQRSTKL